MREQSREVIRSCHSWEEFTSALSRLGKTEKGEAFELLTRLYLRTEDIYTTKLDKVWHHEEIPQKVVDALGLSKPEIGVDLVARVRGGGYWAIQCKFHQDASKNVTYKELAPFLSITGESGGISYRLVSTSAHGVSRRVAEVGHRKLGYLTSERFSRLGREEFKAFHALLRDEFPPPPKPREPWKHQREAREAAQGFFANPKNRRGKIIHPCGSGKSLIAYWIAEALRAQRVLIAVPSLALVRQTLEVWTQEAKANGVSVQWMAVCSDEDVKDVEEAPMRESDMAIEVNTGSAEISRFLRGRGLRVLVSTYQSGQAVSAGARGIVFDLGIYDEAHKTVGDKIKPFAHLLHEEHVQVKRRVFMTATERQFKGNSDEYISMDDEAVYGSHIHTMTFKEALDAEILSDYKIIATVVTSGQIKALIEQNAFVRADGKEWSVEDDASTLASLILLRKAVEEQGIQHTISFHRSIQRAKDFRALNKLVRTVSAFHVSGKQSAKERSEEVNRFIEHTPSLITNARCLTEGVDIPQVDGVLFADPKRSKIDIVQAAGRALRRYEGKACGYIIVPVGLDEDSMDPQKEAFAQIIAVVSALGIQDERIIEEIKAIKEGKPRPHNIFFLEETGFQEIKHIPWKTFYDNIHTEIWDRLSFGWIKGYEHLKAYVAREGNARVHPKHKEDGFNLGTWVNNRRQEYKKGKLSEPRIKALKALPGWVWDPLEEDFQEGFSHLKKFVAREGNARVHPKHKEDGFNLGPWVNSRRQEYKKESSQSRALRP